MRALALCAGYGGLELATGIRAVAYAEKDPYAATVFAARHPGLDNIGDITQADWEKVRDTYAPDVIIAGFPCQDISNAGPRKGITGERSSVWGNVADAVRLIRPRIVFLENVAAILRRGLDVVVTDLAAIGYDARWVCLRASDVGACHRRDRWFCVAYPSAEDTHLTTGIQWGTAASGQAQGGWTRSDTGGRSGIPAVSPAGVSLHPTPAARDWKSGASNLIGVNARPLNEVAVNLLAEPAKDDRWVASNGTDYGPAVRRWEMLVGRTAPDPTEPGTRGNRRLSPEFAEWMMGLPEGWVTGVPDIPRKEQLRIIGNGVVPQQARAAFGHLTD